MAKSDEDIAMIEERSDGDEEIPEVLPKNVRKPERKSTSATSLPVHSPLPTSRQNYDDTTMTPGTSTVHPVRTSSDSAASARESRIERKLEELLLKMDAVISAASTRESRIERRLEELLLKMDAVIERSCLTQERWQKAAAVSDNVLKERKWLVMGQRTTNDKVSFRRFEPLFQHVVAVMAFLLMLFYIYTAIPSPCRWENLAAVGGLVALAVVTALVHAFVLA